MNALFAKKGDKKIGDKFTSKFPPVQLNGHAIFCLHSPDAKWYQGRFIEKIEGGGSGRTFGMLNLIKPLDDCIACAESGYNEVESKLINFQKTRKVDKLDEEGERFVLYSHTVTTGGDELRMRTKNDDELSKSSFSLSFDADKVETGARGVSTMRRAFPSIAQKGCGGDVPESDEDLADFFPDVVIVIGRMVLTVPREFLRMQLENVYDDGLLEDD